MMNNQTINLSNRQLALVSNLVNSIVTNPATYSPQDVTAAQALVNGLTRLDVDVEWTGRGQRIALVVEHWSMGV